MGRTFETKVMCDSKTVDQNDNVFFSVIVPVYNSELYLSECLDSVLTQTYQSFEIIIIDDGSTDKSGEICDAYSEKDKRVSVIHQKNRGSLFSRVLGIDNAKGEYVLFLDSDDTLKEYALSVLNSKISKSACDCVIFGMDRIKEGKVILPFCSVFEKDTIISEKRELYKTLFVGETFNSMCIKAVKKSVFHGFDYTDFFGTVSHGEDRIQTVEIAKNASSVLFLTSSLYNYRMNSGSITHNAFSSDFRQNYTVSKYVYGFLKNENLFSEKDFSVYFGEYLATMMKWIKLIAKSDLKIEEKVCCIRSYKEDDFYHVIKRSGPSTNRLSVTDKILYLLLGFSMFKTIVWLCNLKKR